MSDLMDRKEQLYAALHAQIEQKFADAAEAGVDADVFADPAAIAAKMVSALPTSNVYDQLGGPFYDTAGLTTWLGLSKQALAKRVKVGSVIACQLDDYRGTWVFPTWQFTDDRTVLAGLSDVWRILCPAADDPWMALFWLRARHPALGGAAPVDWLIAGGDLATVVAEARNDAERWTA
ncbi:hypothetical protein L5G28_16240 [Gordonia sp. HY285]|uniref:hypothetical protein n=1 Tax=Gordonia liuliyuniae TaxID=2911517 RepID=UPI001F357C73|nr:hypothetical protein [Gordonia liuliyuniae]MCF8611696.1 hypothetical protein [Gordonia liuliyuniae]